VSVNLDVTVSPFPNSPPTSLFKDVSKPCNIQQYLWLKGCKNLFRCAMSQ
jgi:hypothetical protein